MACCFAWSVRSATSSGLRAVYKLLAQVAVAVGAFALGFRIEAVFLPFIGTLQMGVFALPVTLLWIVGITNAVNLIDGLDGLAAGIAFFAAFTSFVVAFLSGSAFVALTMATLMGALVGFLFFNFNPARIFMGDSGSYFLGYLLATTALAGGVQQKASTAVSLLVPVIALGLPIFDTLFSMVRRLLRAAAHLLAGSRARAPSPARARVDPSPRGDRAVRRVDRARCGRHRGLARAKLGGRRRALLGERRLRRARAVPRLFRVPAQPRSPELPFYDSQTNRLRVAVRQAAPALTFTRSERAVFEFLPRVVEIVELGGITLLVGGAEQQTWTSGPRRFERSQCTSDAAARPRSRSACAASVLAGPPRTSRHPIRTSSFSS